jgi:hypothetical protein
VFDGFKILLLNSLHILEYSSFEEISNHCDNDGKLHKTIYKYKGVSFYHFYESDTILLYVSFHKFWNDGIHNYNNFTYLNFLDSVNGFLKTFSISPYNCELKNVEYGVNLEMKYNVNNLLDCLLFHENKTPLKPLKTDFRFKHQRYQLKVYNKSENYKNICDSDNILRIEVKNERMIQLNKNGIYNLNDLLNTECLPFFNKQLLTHWNNILMYDFTINTKALKIRDLVALKDFQNPLYWQSLKPNQRHRPKQRLKQIIKDNSEQIQQYISDEIIRTLKTMV